MAQTFHLAIPEETATNFFKWKTTLNSLRNRTNDLISEVFRINNIFLISRYSYLMSLCLLCLQSTEIHHRRKRKVSHLIWFQLTYNLDRILTLILKSRHELFREPFSHLSRHHSRRYLGQFIRHQFGALSKKNSYKHKELSKNGLRLKFYAKLCLSRILMRLIKPRTSLAQ